MTDPASSTPQDYGSRLRTDPGHGRWSGVDTTSRLYSDQAAANQTQAYAQGYGQAPGTPESPGHPGHPGYPTSSKTKVVAAILAFLVGGTGAHNFYIGNTGRAIAQLVSLIVIWVAFLGGYGLIFAETEAEVVTSYGGLNYYTDNDAMIVSGVLTILVSSAAMFALWVWTIIEFILILAGNGRYTRDGEGRQLS